MTVTQSIKLFVAPVRFPVLLGVLAACALSPAIPVASAQESAPRVNIQFHVLPLEQGLDDIVYFNGRDEIGIRASAFTLSPYPMPYRGEPALRFYRKGTTAAPETDGSAENGQAQPGSVPAADAGQSLPAAPAPVAEVMLAPGMKEMILMFVPSADGTWRVVPMRNDLGALARGKARMVNLTGAPLVIRAGGRDTPLVPIRAGESAVVTGTDGLLSFEVALEDNGVWQRALSNTISFEPHERRTVFFIRSDAEVFKQRRADGSLVALSPIQMFVIEN